MPLPDFAFYILAAACTLSAFTVIAARNPVHSVLFLIAAFFNAAGLWVLLGAEFLALILVVVYVGAVAVLFLFVVMMLDIDAARLREGFLQYMPIGAAIGFVLLLELLLVFGATPDIVPVAAAPIGNNTEMLGRVLYTDYIYPFQAAGAVLLVAMIGAIVLTLQHRDNPKRQNIGEQNARTPEDSVSLVDVERGQGLRK